MTHQFIILAYGRSPFLRACAASVCAQSEKSKVVIATSTPSDYISNIADEFDLPVHVNPNSRGIAADWNFALSSATEDLVTLAHQDDLYYPEFVAETVQLFQAAPDACLCFTDYQEIDESGRALPTTRVIFIKRLLHALAVGRCAIARRRTQRRNLLAWGSVIPCPSVTLNRAVAGDFRFADEFTINLDWDAWWRLHALDRPFVFSRKVLMGHRLHREAETSRGKRDGRRAVEDRKMFRRIWPAPIATALAELYRAGY